MVDVKAGTTADDARRSSAEAVLRIREESRLRVARRRHRACFSWCMVASLVGGISLATMDAYDAHRRVLLAEQDAAVAQREEQAARAAAALEQERRERDLARRLDEKERALIRAQYDERKALDDCGGPRSRTRRGTRRGS